jgi:hypothetical protein
MKKSTVSKVMSELARKGAKKRLKSISPERRAAIAKTAAAARWAKKSDNG